jgi:hypothetical protein
MSSSFCSVHAVAAPLRQKWAKVWTTDDVANMPLHIEIIC